jgi:hypothetical protein
MYNTRVRDMYSSSDNNEYPFEQRVIDLDNTQELLKLFTAEKIDAMLKEEYNYLE